MSARLAELNAHYTGKDVQRSRKNLQLVQHHHGNDSPHVSGTSAQDGNTNNTGSILKVLVEKFWELKVPKSSKATFCQSFIIKQYSSYEITNESNSPRNKLIRDKASLNNCITWQINQIRSKNVSMRRLVPKLFVKWFIYQQELHLVMYKFPLMLNKWFQTWPLSLPLSLWDMSATGKVNLVKTGYVTNKKHLQHLRWLITLAPGGIKPRSYWWSNYGRSDLRWYYFPFTNEHEGEYSQYRWSGFVLYVFNLLF